MGTTSVRTSQSAKDYILGLYEREPNLEIVDSSFRAGEGYLAVRQKQTNEVFAVVVLTSRSQGDLNYKEISEDMGPYYHNCPDRLLDKLSPTTNAYALAWRERCRNIKKEKKLHKEMSDNLASGQSIGSEFIFVRHWEGGGKYPLVVKKVSDNKLVRITLTQAYDHIKSSQSSR